MRINPFFYYLEEKLHNLLSDLSVIKVVFQLGKQFTIPTSFKQTVERGQVFSAKSGRRFQGADGGNGNKVGSNRWWVGNERNDKECSNFRPQGKFFWPV